MLVGALIHFLIVLLFLGLFYWIAITIISAIPGIPPVFIMIVRVVCLVILLIVLLDMLLPLAGSGYYRGLP
jgi:hypothetical protein